MVYNNLLYIIIQLRNVVCNNEFQNYGKNYRTLEKNIFIYKVMC